MEYEHESTYTHTYTLYILAGTWSKELELKQLVVRA